MGERIYVELVDWDAADRSPLDYISEARLRAETDYEPDTPSRPNPDHDPALVALIHECGRRAHRLMHEEAS